MALDIERRIVSRPMDARAAEGETPASVTGYAAVFNQQTDIAGVFREQIAPGAFTESINRKDDVRALFNHDANNVLGRTTAGTLTLAEDATGLRYDISPPSWAGPLLESIKRGDITQSSFAFTVEPDGESWAYPKDGSPIRTITRATLYDVSPVTYPAYTGTSVSARATHTATDRPDVSALSAATERLRLALALAEVE